jgi:hypothetical protein
MVQRIVSVLGVVAAFGMAADVRAQSFDHLSCHKVKDTLRKEEYVVDLVPSDAAFPLQPACKVKAPAKLLCTPVAPAGALPGAPAPGPAADAIPQLCYKLKCPKLELDVAVADRFGDRTIQVKAPTMLCVPAVPPTSSTTSTTVAATTSTTTTTLAGVEPPSAGCPVVNEIMTGGPSSGADEFVEVLNPCPVTIDLTGARLVYRSAAGSSDSTLVGWSDGALLAPGMRLVYGGATFAGPRDGDLGAGLSGTGGGVAIRASGGSVVDSVGYGTATNAFVEGAAAPAPAAGSSIGRLPDGADTDQNATDWLPMATPTPGAPNAGS